MKHLIRQFLKKEDIGIVILVRFNMISFVKKKIKLIKLNLDTMKEELLVAVFVFGK